MARKFTITAEGNEKTKTFDIVKLWNDGVVIIYCTDELSPEEFEDMEYYTAGDWVNFLNTSLSYHVVNTIKNTKLLVLNDANEYMVYDYETETANIICLQDFNDFELFHEERKEIVNLSIGESFLLTDIGKMIAVITRVK